MKRIFVLVLVVVVLFTGGSVAVDKLSAYQGEIDVDGNELQITSHGEGFHLVSPESSLYYSNNQTWNETYNEIGGSQAKVFLVNSDVNDTGEMYQSHVSASLPVGTASVRVLNESSDHSRLILWNVGSSVSLESSAVNDVTVGDDTQEIILRDVSDGDPLTWYSSDGNSIEISDLDTGELIVRDAESDRILTLQDSDGSIMVDSDEGVNEIVLDRNTTATFGNFTADPIFQEHAVHEDFPEQFELTVNNEGNTIESVEATGEPEWIELDSSQSMIDGSQTTFYGDINASTIEDEGYGEITLEANNESATVYVHVDVHSDPVSLSERTYTLPLFGEVPAWVFSALIGMIVFLFVTFTWVLLDPDRNENVWN